MNKTTMLFIRACKSREYNDKRYTLARIKSVYRRFYLCDPDDYKVALINILADIVEEYNLLTVTQLITRLDPNYVFGDRDLYNYIDRCLTTLIGVIRNASVDKFPGLIHPCKFRKKYFLSDLAKNSIVRVE